jgi:UDP-N-acetyl-D-glucosamine dehydrogenase
MTEPNRTADELVERIRAGRISVAVAGLGYVGLPMALLAARRVERVVGIDLSDGRVNAIRDGRSYVDDITDDELAEAVRSGPLSASTDYAAIADCDVILICVPTPLRKTGEPDVSYIVASVDAICEQMRSGILVILESTTYPGTTEELVRPKLEAGGLRAGVDFFLAFSPERIDPGPAYREHTLETVPKVVGGVTPECTRVASEFYSRLVRTVAAVSRSCVAEMVKLLENTYRSVNIAMVNELALMCHQMGIDVWEVVDAAATKPYGYQAFYPGPGLGGHCIPIDPFYLAWKARLHGFEPRFIDLAGRINMSMPRHVIGLICDLLNDASKPVRGSRVHVLGVAYKPDVSDVRESPALAIIEELRARGARVTYTDAHVQAITLGDGETLQSVPLDDADLPGCDCAVIITSHADFPWQRIVANAPLILDTRNALKEFDDPHVHKL